MSASRPVRVDLLINPFCMASRDLGTVQGLCEEMGAELHVHNLWEIGDNDPDLPELATRLVHEWRTGQRPGSVYCNVFVAGERIPLDRWPDHLETVKARISAAKQEGLP